MLFRRSKKEIRMPELNLDNAMCELVLKALNKYDSRKEVSKALGVTVRVVGKLITKYKIKKKTKQVYER